MSHHCKDKSKKSSRCSKSINVMSFNMAAINDSPTDQIVNVILAADADIIGLQETRSFSYDTCNFSIYNFKDCPPLGVATITNATTGVNPTVFTAVNTFSVGQSVRIIGVNPSTYNGTYVVSAATGVDFSVAALRTGPYVSGGNATEGASKAKDVADALGFYYYDQLSSDNNPAIWANAVVSRYPITGVTKNQIGVKLNVKGRNVYVLNLHLTFFPYVPYQLLGIPYGPAPFISTEEEAIQMAVESRALAYELLYQDLDEAKCADAIFITGDFNEPSFRDWIQPTVNSGKQPLVVNWPTTKNIERRGFTDALRAIYPDPVSKPAMTYTPSTSPDDPNDHHDRLDFVFVKGKCAKVKSAAILGEALPGNWGPPDKPDIVVTPWPSDHRAVVSTIRIR
jgi:exodeoxyribonuclease-3